MDFFKTTHSVDGGVKYFKERFVAQALSLKEGIDLEEMFALVATHTSIKTILLWIPR